MKICNMIQKNILPRSYASNHSACWKCPTFYSLCWNGKRYKTEIISYMCETIYSSFIISHICCYFCYFIIFNRYLYEINYIVKFFRTWLRDFYVLDPCYLVINATDLFEMLGTLEIQRSMS